MGHILSHPLVSKAVQRRGNEQFKIGSAEMQGYRVDMEDTMTILTYDQQKEHKNLSFFGVYDGHGGDHASIFCAKRMHEIVLKPKTPNEPKTLIQSVMDADAEFLRTEEGDHKNHGSTSVLALVESPDMKAAGVKSWKIMVANVGDSRAILIRKDGTVVELTVDHKPETKEEEERIQRAGGSVSANRVDGQLAMSRAIGDYSYKGDASLSVTDQKVIPVADVTQDVAYEGDRLLICCDGIVEQMTGQEAGKFVFDTYAAGETDPALVCAALLDQSIVAGSKDNHSAMIIEFTTTAGKAFETKENAHEYLPGAFAPFEGSTDFRDAYIKDAAKHGYSKQDDAKWAELMAKAKKAEESLPAGTGNAVAAAGAGGDQDADGPGNVGLGQILGQLSQQQKLLALMTLLQGRDGAGGAGGAGPGAGQ